MVFRADPPGILPYHVTPEIRSSFSRNAVQIGTHRNRISSYNSKDIYHQPLRPDTSPDNYVITYCAQRDNMAEIRIPTDRIPHDMLVYLQAVGRSMSNIVSSTPSPCSSPAASTSAFSSSPSSSFSSSSTLSSSVISPESSSMAVTVTPSPQCPPTTFTPTAFTPTSRPSESVNSIECDPIPYHCVYSPSKKSPSKIMADRREASRFSTPISASRVNVDHIDSMMVTSSPSVVGHGTDEVDGGQGIVHAFSDPTRSQRHLCHEALDDSDIVRVFPEEDASAKVGKSTGDRFPSDDSDIVRIFATSNDENHHNDDDDDHDDEGRMRMSNRSEVSSFKRSDIVRAFTPTKQLSSSLNFEMIEGDQPRQCSPLRPDDPRKSPEVFRTNSPLPQTPKKELPACMYSEASPYKVNKMAPRFKAGVAPDKNSNSMLSMQSPQKSNSYTKCAPSNASVSMRSQPQMIASQSNGLPLRLGEISPCKPILKTPMKTLRPSPPEFGHLRRSPGFPTPPETPDACDVSEDEVFTYDEVVASNGGTSHIYDANTSSRQLLEPTSRRNEIFVHHRNNVKRSPNHQAVTQTGGRAGKRLSPFSPAQGVAEMHVADRKPTRKRLSFDDLEEHDNVSSQTRSWSRPSFSDEDCVHGEPTSENTVVYRASSSPKAQSRGSVSEMRPESPLAHCQPFLSSDQVFASPKSLQLQHSTSGSHFPPKTAGNSVYQSPQHHQHHQLSGGSSNLKTISSPPASFHHHAPAPSPIQETLFNVERVLALQGQGQGQGQSQRLSLSSSSRLRVRSMGDDDTDGNGNGHQVVLQSNESDLGPMHRRTHTFSAYGKRRRIERDDDFEMASAEAAGSFEMRSSSLPLPVASTPPQLPPPTSSSALSTTTTTSSSPSSSQIPSTPGKTSLPKEQASAETTWECACSTIEKNFLKMAEGAYRRIRCLDAPANDFERFRQALAQTNDMLRESMAVVKNIKAMCGHDRQTERHPEDNL